MPWFVAINASTHFFNMGGWSMTVDRSTRLFRACSYLIVGIVIFITVIPFLLVVIGSFTNESEIIREGYRLFPRRLSLSAYRLVFEHPGAIVRAYGITLIVAVTGVSLGLLFMSMGAYVLGRPDFRYRNVFSFSIYLTMLFPGGLVPLYLMVVSLFQWKNNLLALILPAMMVPVWIFILRTFMQSIPFELIESGKVEGASEYTIFFRIILPLSKAGQAVIGLFALLFYWNNWRLALLFLSRRSLYPIQYLLYTILQDTMAADSLLADMNLPVAETPQESLKLALAVIATLPVLFAYPFVQRYFVKGITIGAVKG